MKALVVEDEVEVIEAITLCLTIPWPDVALIATSSGEDAIQLTHWLMPDVVLLDLQLADVYGLHVLKEIRSFSDAPLVILTANNQETARWTSIQLGADDYLVKPFTHIDLLSSLKAAMSRTHPGSSHGLTHGFQGNGLIVNIPGRQVLFHGASIKLNRNEWGLLLALVHSQDGIVPFSKLGSKSAGLENITLSAAANAYQGLNKKLGDNAAGAGLIFTQEEEGYRLTLTF